MTTLPAYTPANPHRDHIVGYANRIENYGKPPAGYRWLKVGDKVPEGSIFANYHNKEWRKMRSADIVADHHYAFAAPIAPELIPSDPSAKLVLEVVKRTTRKVDFKIASQTYSGPIHKPIFQASNGIEIKSYYHPQILDSEVVHSLYIRGTEKNRDNDVLSCLPSQFKRIVAAVAEYNGLATPKVKAPKVEPISSEPPKYAGPEISVGDDLNTGMAKAGPAPKGWRYVTTCEKIANGDLVLFKMKWVKVETHHKSWIGFDLSPRFWPVIRRVEPCSPPKSPESILAELQSENAALKAKVAEQAKIIAAIKKIIP